MIVSLLMTVEKSLPLMSRLVNVEDSMHLGELSQVIDAAFGFSGAASHLYMGPAGTTSKRDVLTASPGPGERSEDQVTVAQIKEMTYVYDPSADWNIHLKVLGSSRLDGPTPLLIDALGPDVVEACNGPALMSRFHAEARRIAAGLDPQMDVAPLLLSFLPVMSPERLLQRLTQADQVTVSERISFVAEDLFLDTADAAEEDPLAPKLATAFEEYLQKRPDLQDILSLDPTPERNPTMIAAMAEFFEEVLGDDDDTGDTADPIHDALCSLLWEILAQPRQRIKLTSTGALPPAHVVNVAHDLGIALPSPNPRERSVPEIRTLREILTAAGLLQETSGWLYTTGRGMQLIDDPFLTPDTVARLRAGFENVYGRDDWAAILERLTTTGSVTIDVFNLLVAMRVLNPTSRPPELTDAGAEFLTMMDNAR